MKQAITSVVLLGVITALGLNYLPNSSPIVANTQATSTYQRVGPVDIYPPIINGQLLGTQNPEITQANIKDNICNPNWSTKSIRPTSSYTTNLKIQQMQILGLTGKTGDYEEDHIISLELGGNPTDPNNLFPEPYKASISDGGARNKDKVENFLHAKVCDGSITLLQAQQMIALDWYAVYAQIKNHNIPDTNDETRI